MIGLNNARFQWLYLWPFLRSHSSSFHTLSLISRRCCSLLMGLPFSVLFFPAYRIACVNTIQGLSSLYECRAFSAAERGARWCRLWGLSLEGLSPRLRRAPMQKGQTAICRPKKRPAGFTAGHNRNTGRKSKAKPAAAEKLRQLENAHF